MKNGVSLHFSGLGTYPFENGKKYNLFQFFWFAQKFPVVVLIGMEILLASSTTMNLLPFSKGYESSHILLHE